MNLVFLLLVLLVAIILAAKFPGYSFIVGLTVFFSIGGYLDINAFGFPSFFTVMDLGLIFAFLAGLAEPVVDRRLIFDDSFKKLLFICLFFLFYQIVVTIWIKLGISNPIELLKGIIYHKWRIFGFFFAIPTYFVIQKYSEEIYRIVVFVTFIIMGLYFLTLFTPLELIKVYQFERGLGASILRTTIRNYGYMMMIIPVALVVILNKLRIKYKNFLIIGAVTMFVTVLITMSRITIFSMTGSILITLILVKKYFGLNLSLTVFKGFVFIMSAVIIVLLLFPGIVPSVYSMYSHTFREFLGIIPEGTTQTRTTFELVRMMPLFLNNLWIGTGYLPDFFSSYHTPWELGLADLPLLGNLAIYGVLGFLLYLFRYFLIFNRIKFLFTKHKKNSLFQVLSAYEIALLMWAVIYFFTLIFFRLPNFSSDLVYRWFTIEFGFLIGIIFGLVRKYEILVKETSNI